MGKWLNEIFGDVESEFKIYRKSILCEVINGCYLILWAILQYGVGKIIRSLALTGLDAWVFLIFQILFGTSTIIFIIIQIYKDTWIMWNHSNREIQKAKSDKHDNFSE